MQIVSFSHYQRHRTITYDIVAYPRQRRRRHTIDRSILDRMPAALIRHAADVIAGIQLVRSEWSLPR